MTSAMKVNDDRPVIMDLTQAQAAHSKKGTAEAASSFRQVLMDGTADANGKLLRDLLEKIGEQGERVAARTDIAELKKYRQMVTDFLHEALRCTYEAEKNSQFDAKGHYKEYAVVKKVDAELEKLTQQVLSEQRDNLGVLEQLGIIRGLLVDLLV
jgi:uncharacterized protein YaaR (DUF327 family)